MLLLQRLGTHHEGVLSLLNVAKIKATGVALKDQEGLENKKGWEMPSYMHLSKNKVEEKWYFDSGTSRHMTSNMDFFINL